jgi:hypothetical protein
MNLVAKRMSDVRSVVGSCQYRFRRREGNMPVVVISSFVTMALLVGHTRIAACRDLAISLSCSSRGLLPKISGSQKVPTAPFMCPIFP